jgi:hypothetical protein
LFPLALPDAWIVSGYFVQTAWNVQTRRAVDLRHQRLRPAQPRAEFLGGKLQGEGKGVENAAAGAHGAAR